MVFGVSSRFIFALLSHRHAVRCGAVWTADMLWHMWTWKIFFEISHFTKMLFLYRHRLTHNLHYTMGPSNYRRVAVAYENATWGCAWCMQCRRTTTKCAAAGCRGCLHRIQHAAELLHACAKPKRSFDATKDGIFIFNSPLISETKLRFSFRIIHTQTHTRADTARNCEHEQNEFNFDDENSIINFCGQLYKRTRQQTVCTQFNLRMEFIKFINGWRETSTWDRPEVERWTRDELCLHFLTYWSLCRRCHVCVTQQIPSTMPLSSRTCRIASLSTWNTLLFARARCLWPNVTN